MFLVVALFLDIWKYFIKKEAMWAGLTSSYFAARQYVLGIYYNLSVWYKLTNKTMIGAWITIAGAVITMVVNYFFIPLYGYTACAWATFLCYGTMMVMSYVLGQKYYHVPYAWKKLCLYSYCCTIVFCYKGLNHLVSSFIFSVGSGLVLVTLFPFYP